MRKFNKSKYLTSLSKLLQDDATIGERCASRVFRFYVLWTIEFQKVRFCSYAKRGKSKRMFSYANSFMKSTIAVIMAFYKNSKWKLKVPPNIGI